MNLVPIDKLVEMWAKVHEEALDLEWWREAYALLRPPPEDDQILSDKDEKRSDGSAPDV